MILIDNDKSLTYKDIMNTPDIKRSLEVMKSDMDSIYENLVWTLVNLPERDESIGCKGIQKEN